jgi:nitroimidazol reductase NimA-like FMN-containing flavoprotein (pyridoxamine 5'-phosphate oxidase superfamily)
MDEAELRSDLKRLFEKQRLAVLATHSQGQPYTSLVAFSATPDLDHMVFATGRATRKYANLAADPRVSLLVDNRSNEASDFRDAMAVTATGRAGEADENEKKRLLEDYLAKHPSLAEFAASPTCALLKVRVETYYAVRRFQHVMELHMAP